MKEDAYPLIKVVGISASGKSTLVQGLREAGYNARPVSQEHSNVPALWEEFDPPALLFYLDNTIEGQRHRRPDVGWRKPMLLAEKQRLDHARGHADLHINTAELTAQEVLSVALIFLTHNNIAHAPEALPPVTPTGTVRIKEEGADGPGR